jgi:hypothetical protein
MAALEGTMGFWASIIPVLVAAVILFFVFRNDLRKGVNM